jgi:hypothetical protein
MAAGILEEEGRHHSMARLAQDVSWTDEQVDERGLASSLLRVLFAVVIRTVAPCPTMPFTWLELAVLGLVEGALHALLARFSGEPYIGHSALPRGVPPSI